MQNTETHVHKITNVPVFFIPMALGLKWFWCKSITRAIGRGVGPENLDFLGPKWLSLRSLPFLGPKVSIFKVPPLPMALLMDVAPCPHKIIMFRSRTTETTGTLIVISVPVQLFLYLFKSLNNFQFCGNFVATEKERLNLFPLLFFCWIGNE